MKGARTHIVRTRFRREADAAKFSALAVETDAVSAMRALGYEKDARRVVLNTISMALVSDALHHIYEALSCLERRKSIVALNLLRKPLTDSLVYLTWMLADEDEFYALFSAGDPTALTGRRSARGALRWWPRRWRARPRPRSLRRTRWSRRCSTPRIRTACRDRSSMQCISSPFSGPSCAPPNRTSTRSSGRRSTMTSTGRSTPSCRL